MQNAANAFVRAAFAYAKNVAPSDYGSNQNDDDPGTSSGGSGNLEHYVSGVVEPKKAERPLAKRIMGRARLRRYLVPFARYARPQI